MPSAPTPSSLVTRMASGSAGAVVVVSRSPDWGGAPSSSSPPHPAARSAATTSTPATTSARTPRRSSTPRPFRLPSVGRPCLAGPAGRGRNDTAPAEASRHAHAATEDDLRRIALALPGTEERPGYGGRPPSRSGGGASPGSGRPT